MTLGRPPPAILAACEAACTCAHEEVAVATNATQRQVAIAKFERLKLEAEDMLRVAQATNRRVAREGPQTGRARRGHWVNEMWIKRERRKLKRCAKMIKENDKAGGCGLM